MASDRGQQGRAEPARNALSDSGAPAGDAVGVAMMVAALLPFGLGYFLSYLYRAANAVVAPDLVRDVGLTAGELGLLTAAYLLSFALFQIPLGILLDRYGPRRVQAALVAIGGVGALLFGFGQSAPVLLAARAIIGLGFCGGLMASFKAVVIWVPEVRRPLANSLVMSVGAIGLLVATTPLELAVQAIGWRHVFFWVALYTFGVALVILLVVPERQAKRSSGSLAAELRDVSAIAGDRVYIAMAPLLAIGSGAHIALQTLWAGPWFRDIAGLDRTAVANRLFLMAAAFFVGILITGVATDQAARRGGSIIRVMLAFFGLFFLAQVIILLEIPWLALPAWMLFAMSGQVSVLAFPWFASYYGVARSARANSGVNMTMFLCAFGFQYLVGLVIDRFPLAASGGYLPEAYRLAFVLLLVMQGLALTWYGIHWRLIEAADRQVRESYRARQ